MVKEGGLGIGFRWEGRGLEGDYLAEEGKWVIGYFPFLLKETFQKLVWRDYWGGKELFGG